MRQNTFFFLLLLIASQSAIAQDLQQMALSLRKIEPITYAKQLIATDGKSAYEIKFEQPLNHQKREKTFEQRIYLTHVGYDRPTVIVTEGYARNRNYVSELAELLNANQLIVEHRYFGNSVPDSLAWDQLNISQAAEDHHQIIQEFKKLYKGKWISTGISKGGATALYHRYFYPNDVDVTIPYVAPINLEQEDPRIYEFLRTVGDAECRQKIFEFQRRLLEEREELLPLIKWYSIGKEYQFSLGLEKAFEYAALEYSFSFWQWGHDCDAIPSKDATTDELLEHLIEIVGFSLYTDQGVAYYAPHFHQAMTEAGYYGFETSGFKDLLTAIEEPNNRPFAPPGASREFRPELIKKIHDWLVQKGDNIIYIYGALDTWSATAVNPSKKTDALQIMMKDKSHGDARIKNFTPSERKAMIDLLEKWLEMDIE